MEGVAGLAASGVHEIPHGFFQQRLLVVLVPHSGSTKSFRKWNHATWPLVHLWLLSLAGRQFWRVSTILLGHPSHQGTTVVDIFLIEKWLGIQGFTNFTSEHFITKWHNVNSSQKSHLYRCTWDSILSVISQEFWQQVSIRTKTDLKTDSIAWSVWTLLLCDWRAINSRNTVFYQFV